MDLERGLKLVKVELPPEVQIMQPEKARGHRRRVVAAGALIGVAFLFVHNWCTFGPGSWLDDGRLDHIGYDESGSPTGKAAEEIFM